MNLDHPPVDYRNTDSHIGSKHLYSRITLANLALTVVAAVAVSACSAQPTPTPTTAAPATSSATAASQTTTPAAPDAPVQEFTGSGSDVVTLTAPVTDSVMALHFECTKCGDRFAVSSDNELDNEIVHGYRYGGVPSFKGTSWFGLNGGTTTALQVKSTGKWTLRVGTVGQLGETHDGASKISGTSDTILVLDRGTKQAALTHDGESNFILDVAVPINESGSSQIRRSVVNEIGHYTGNVLIGGDPDKKFFVQIHADGAWTYTPKV